MFNRLVSFGIIYGFSDASIIHFLRYRCDPSYTVPRASESKKLVGTGLIIAPEEEDIPEEVIIAAIKENRISPRPFPTDKGGNYSNAELLEFMNHPRFIPRYDHLMGILKSQYGLFTMPPRK